MSRRVTCVLICLVLLADAGCAGKRLLTGNNQLSLSPGWGDASVWDPGDNTGPDSFPLAIQASYARRLVHNDQTDLYVELPVTMIPQHTLPLATPMLLQDSLVVSVYTRCANALSHTTLVLRGSWRRVRSVQGK